MQLKTNQTMTRDKAISTCREILSRPSDFAILDTETSGFNGEIMDIAIIDPTGDLLYQGYRKPIGDVHEKALEVHGLTAERMDQLGTHVWVSVMHPEIADAAATKTLLFYNAPFDEKIINNTAIIEGTASPIKGCITICVMRMWYAFTGVNKGKLQGGDHTALGDCKATLGLIKTMAAAEFSFANEKPASSEQLVAELEALKAESKAIALKQQVIETRLLTYIEDTDGPIELADGRIVSMAQNIVQLKTTVEIADLPNRFRSEKRVVSVNKKQAEKEIWAAINDDDDQLIGGLPFTFKLSRILKIGDKK
jgi:DNA polymerase III subunit epsilon